MIARRYETVVGIFVVASMAALLVMALIVAQQEGLFQEYVTYRTIFKNVSGLKPGSEVHLAGVTVGTVLSTTVNAEGSIAVTFHVMKKNSDRIREDTRSTIGFLGLLGDKSLDLTAGSLSKAPIPPAGLVTSVEPLDITQIMAQAGPALDDLQKILGNLRTVTDDLAEPASDTRKILAEVRDIVSKINAGTGSMGQLVNDPGLYRDTADAVAQLRKFADGLEKGKGVVSTLLHDQAFKDQTVKTMAELQATFAKLNLTSADLKEAMARLPDIAKKLESFVANLDKAGKGLPGLVTEGQTLFGDADQAAKAAKQLWPLRNYVPRPQEHTIRMDAAPGKD
ncbi:MAG: MCE family protein [Proteobacteria bacterium]|nr:MCE family protein [Pseudomonadota bacterium]MBU4355937.1 MCE family protein [Pseudomonadota bacterium]MBU4447505.1 MCE family protein [Pseudomonadota bacterium]MCG2772058.1 MlaD family protein [Desulfobacterales bacterium]